MFTVATVAAAADFGGHIGYFDNSVKKPFIGVDFAVPLGPIAIMPNLDYWRAHGYGYWIANGDVTLRFATGGSSYWIGAGPTYGWVTGTGSSSGSGTGYSMPVASPNDYTPPSTTPNPTNPTTPTNGATVGGVFGNGQKNAWGYDVNAGITLGKMGGLHPYVTARYNKIKDLKAGGVALGLRFGGM
ncbi:MAG TPA: hypothetical protein VGR95_11320 [Thermoanaerobaculia bacterium]|nr:hypothetical protein [Thermoanaerobaculia bacterium]